MRIGIRHLYTPDCYVPCFVQFVHFNVKGDYMIEKQPS